MKIFRGAGIVLLSISIAGSSSQIMACGASGKSVSRVLCFDDRAVSTVDEAQLD